MIEIGQKYRDMDRRMTGRVVTVVERAGWDNRGFIIWKVHDGAKHSRIREDRLVNSRFFKLIPTP